MIVDSQRVGITVTLPADGYCKYLAVMNYTPGCSQTVYYLPAFNCTGKKKIKSSRFNFKDELPVIRTMLNTVAAREELQLCVFDLTPASYDDVMLQFIDEFIASKRWKEYLTTHPNPKDYDEELVAKIAEGLHVIKEVDQFVAPYKFTTGSIRISSDSKHLISKKELKRLGKDESLKIPLPDHLKLQLHGRK